MSSQDCAVCPNKTKKGCSACKAVLFCSKKCQKLIWKSHKYICKTSPFIPLQIPMEENEKKEVLRFVEIVAASPVADESNRSASLERVRTLLTSVKAMSQPLCIKMIRAYICGLGIDETSNLTSLPVPFYRLAVFQRAITCQLIDFYSQDDIRRHPEHSRLSAEAKQAIEKKFEPILNRLVRQGVISQFLHAKLGGSHRLARLAVVRYSEEANALIHHPNAHLREALSSCTALTLILNE